MKFVDPNKIGNNDLPLIVFSDHTSGIIQFLIKWKTKSAWNHVMVMHRPGFFASQGNMFSEVPLSRYMKRQNRLKFLEIKNLTIVNRLLLLKRIERDLKAPWYKRFYDYLGIVGQAIGVKKVNSPGNMYCSERVANWLKALFTYIPKHPSPQNLNNVFSDHEQDFRVYGKWDGD